MAEKPSRRIEEMPPENSPEAKNFRSPVPYKRIKPEYTGVAYLYGIAATVDILLDLDEKGNILRTEIVRWAGYGLDEAVTDAVRKMNWRPAERAGKPLPLRVLLRYNFKKVEKERSNEARTGVPLSFHGADTIVARQSRLGTTVRASSSRCPHPWTFLTKADEIYSRHISFYLVFLLDVRHLFGLVSRLVFYSECAILAAGDLPEVV